MQKSKGKFATKEIELICSQCGAELDVGRPGDVGYPYDAGFNRVTKLLCWVCWHLKKSVEREVREDAAREARAAQNSGQAA